MKKKQKTLDVLYKRGDSFKEALDCMDTLVNMDGFELAEEFTERKEEISKFKSFKNYHVWFAKLLKNGRPIKERLDDMHADANRLQDTAFTSKAKLDEKLSELIDFQETIRNFEYDSYEFINTLSATEIANKHGDIQAILSILEEVSKSYDRIYSQIRQKLSNISNARVSLGSLTLSITAILIAVLSLLIDKS